MTEKTLAPEPEEVEPVAETDLQWVKDRLVDEHDIGYEEGHHDAEIGV
jgi:hypothetical protein